MVVTLDEVRRLVIFATVPDDRHLCVMLDRADVLACVDEDPAIFRPLYRGKRLACLVVDLEGVARPRLRELLTEARLHKARASETRPFLQSTRRAREGG